MISVAKTNAIRAFTDIFDIGLLEVGQWLQHPVAVPLRKLGPESLEKARQLRNAEIFSKSGDEIDEWFLIAQSQSDDRWKWKASRATAWVMGYFTAITNHTAYLSSKGFDTGSEFPRTVIDLTDSLWLPLGGLTDYPHHFHY